MKQSPPSNHGFSMIEMVIVIAILLILASLALPMLEMTEVRARERILRDSLRETRYAIDRYRAERSSEGCPYPPSIASLTVPIPTSLPGFTKSPLKKQGNPGPFLANLPQNPFAGAGTTFYWEIRDALPPGNWIPVTASSATTPSGWMYDIRVPSTGGWITALDGSKYADW